MLRHAVRLNTCTEIAITKLDVLAPFPELKVCVAYEGEDGTRYDHVPYHQSVLHKVRPGLRDAARVGSATSTGAERIEDLPDEARDYVRFVEEVVRRARQLRRRSGPAPRPVRSCCPAAALRSPVAASDEDPRRRLGRARARAGVGVATRSRARREVFAAPGNPGIAERVAVLRRRPVRRRRGRRSSPTTSTSTWSSSVPRFRWSRASPTRCGRRGRLAFGPGAAGARLEGSKAWMKEVLRRRRRADRAPRGVRRRRRTTRALAFLESSPRPYVVKTDGLAAGKGVVVTESLADAARRGARLPLRRGVRRRRPHARDRGGPHRARSSRCSSLCDGDPDGVAAGTGAGLQAHRRRRHRPQHRRHGRLLTRARSQDPPWSTSVMATCGAPHAALAAPRATSTYRGVLYAGLMLTRRRPEGDRVQRALRRSRVPGGRCPALACDLAEPACEAAAAGERLRRSSSAPTACVTVVLAVRGLPGVAAHRRRDRRSRRRRPRCHEVTVFHAGHGAMRDGSAP